MSKLSLLDTAPAPRIGWPVLRPDGKPLMYYRERDSIPTMRGTPSFTQPGRDAPRAIAKGLKR